MDVSVIIVSFNTRELTLKAIGSVYEYTKGLDFEIIVVDNHSDDNSVEAIRQQYPAVCVLQLAENIGFGRANNEGMKVAKGMYYFLLNSDAFLISNAIADFFTFLQDSANKQIGVVGGELLTQDHSFKQMSFGNFPSLFEVICSFGVYKLFETHFKRKISSGVINYDDKIKEVGYITGADMFVRRSAINKVGGFDSDFFMYYEDTELSYRINAAGLKSVILPQVKIVHLVSFYRDRHEPLNKKKVKIYQKSRKLYYRKCHGALYAALSNILYSAQILFRGILGQEKWFISKAIIALTV